MRKKALLLTLLLYALSVVSAFGETASGVITMDFNLSHQTEGEEVRLWIPYPTSDEQQTVSDVRINGNYAEAGVYTDRIFKTPMLFARWDKQAKSRKLSFSFQAQRDEVIASPLPATEAAWSPEDHSIDLAATRLGPIDGKVKKLADKITRGKTGVLAKARAIYDWTVDNTFRDPETRGCGMGDVDRLLKSPGGKCADISSVYVALARAAGVPSREVFGIRMGKKEVQNITGWQHCWAEFFLPGHGWVPVDPADVRKMMLKENLTLTDPKTVAYREYFFGGIDPYRIKLGEGRDLILNPAQQGEPVNYLMYPFAQVGEKTVDWLDPSAFVYTIIFQQQNKKGYGVIDTESLERLLAVAPDDLVVVDARNPEEYQEVHIQGAISLPQKKFKKYAHLLPKNKSTRIIFYCNGIKCGKSKKAAKKATAMGYTNVSVYAEGMPVWEEKGMAIYAGPDYEKRIETTKVSPQELNRLLDSKGDNFTVVDVRDQEEYEEGHMPGAVNIPVASFASRSEVLDKNKKIIVYCNSGGRSYNAYRKLMKLGYKDIHQALFYDWKAAGLLVEKAD